MPARSHLPILALLVSALTSPCWDRRLWLWCLHTGPSRPSHRAGLASQRSQISRAAWAPVVSVSDEGPRSHVHNCVVKDEAEDYIVLGNAFDEELLLKLQGELNEKDLEELVAHYREEDSEDQQISTDRSTLGAFLDVRQTPWLEDHLLGLFEAVSDRWQLPELDILEDAQYCVYGPGDHFDWHQDQPDVAPPPVRRLSLVLMLSAPGDFSGGDLELNTTGIVRPKLLAGDAIIFPSETVEHRVAPVEAGMRQTLVCWAYAA
ncbi:unnamed protein product [Symbiodinium sp. CCMP2592]|nr:unnamed protein product [Symbiodinium sp. CCMP2592]